MNDLTRFIHKLHFRTFEKVFPAVKDRYPNATEEEVKAILSKFVKDSRASVKQYFNRIFSDHPHAWMMDLLDNKGQTSDYNNKAEREAKEMTKTYPIYWFLFININTRFVRAYPLYRKTQSDILNIIRRFISEHKCVSLTCDKESAFVADETVNFLKQRKISLYVVLDNNHTSLAIIDSFIRHLRDRNATNEKSKYQSHHSKYRNFSVPRMTQLIETYNNSIHSAINMKPIEMENDVKLERKYIAYCLIRRSKSKDHTIPKGHFVRVVIAKDGLMKRRFRLSRECYLITGREGKNYIVSAADHTSLTYPRFRLIDLGAEKPDKYKFADTIPNGWRKPISIINQKAKTYLVSFGDDGAKDVRKVDLRRHHPQIPTKIETEFLKTQQTNKNILN